MMERNFLILMHQAYHASSIPCSSFPILIIMRSHESSSFDGENQFPDWSVIKITIIMRMHHPVIDFDHHHQRRRDWINCDIRSLVRIWLRSPWEEQKLDEPGVTWAALFSPRDALRLTQAPWHCIILWKYDAMGALCGEEGAPLRGGSERGWIIVVFLFAHCVLARGKQNSPSSPFKLFPNFDCILAGFDSNYRFIPISRWYFVSPGSIMAAPSNPLNMDSLLSSMPAEIDAGGEWIDLYYYCRLLIFIWISILPWMNCESVLDILEAIVMLTFLRVSFPQVSWPPPPYCNSVRMKFGLRRSIGKAICSKFSFGIC